jgi:hypothetical protein
MKRAPAEDLFALAQLMKESFLVITDGQGNFDGMLAWGATVYLLRGLWSILPEGERRSAMQLLTTLLPVTELIPADGKPRPRAPAGFRSGGRFR